ncbi:MAG: hypothetical protein QOG65_822 [Actinomycetota bacterium]|nr:hypothetical protein [Actinomycetota bacterium]
MLMLLVASCGSTAAKANSSDPPASKRGPSSTTTRAAPTTTTLEHSTRMSIHLEPTELRLGGTVHIRGAGCLRSGRPGDRVQILLGNLVQPQLVVQVDPHSTTIASDGTFTSDATVPDDALPGTDQVVVRCFGSSGTKELAVTAAVSVTVQSPYIASFSPTKVAAGKVISFRGSCPGQAPYHWLEVEFVAAGGTGASRSGTSSFVLKGALNGGTATVPRTTTPGTYHATARCEEERGLRPLRYFRTIDVVITG